MEMMFAVIGSLAIGLIVRYTMKNRDRLGMLMIPAIGTATGALAWSVGIGAGLTATAPWLWLITFVASAVVSAVVNARVTRRRIESDNAIFGNIARAR